MIRNDKVHVPRETDAKKNQIMNKLSEPAQRHSNLLQKFVPNPVAPGAPQYQITGPLLYQNGSTYQGQVYLGQRHGHGVEITKKGDIYEGGWDKDLKLGRGRMILADGTMYEGEWLNNNCHGLGLYVKNFDNSNKQTYKGSFIDGLQDGYGEEVFFGQNLTYTGEFVKNIKHGRGIMTYPDKTRYEGEFVNGIQHGIGKYNYPDGTLYDGDLNNNLRHGYGTLHTPDGQIYTGYFANGKKEGNGKLCFPDNSIYRGQFADDKMHGEGQFTDNQTIIDKKGIWKQGQRVQWI